MESTEGQFLKCIVRRSKGDAEGKQAADLSWRERGSSCDSQKIVEENNANTCASVLNPFMPHVFELFHSSLIDSNVSKGHGGLTYGVKESTACHIYKFESVEGTSS